MKVAIPYKNILRVAIGTLGILLVPLVAMQLSNDVTWSAADFVVAGTLVFGTGLLYELLASKAQTRKQRILTGVVLLGLLSVVWIQLAVGIFD